MVRSDPPPVVSRHEDPVAALVQGIKDDLGQQQAAEKLTLEKRQAIGGKLFRLKEIVGHGRWLPLLKRIGVPQQTAWRRMRDFLEKEQITHAGDLESQVAQSSRAVECEPEEEMGEENREPGSFDTDLAAAGNRQPTTAPPRDGDRPPTTPPAEQPPSAEGDPEKGQQSQRTQHQADQDRDEGDAFVETVAGICKDLDKIMARMKALGQDRHSYSIHIDSAVKQVRAARQTLWQGRPAHPCPYCKEKKDGACTACKGTGRVKKTTQEDGQDAVGGAA